MYIIRGSRAPFSLMTRVFATREEAEQSILAEVPEADRWAVHVEKQRPEFFGGENPHQTGVTRCPFCGEKLSRCSCRD